MIRYLPCPGCSKTYEGKTLPSYRRVSCRICRGAGHIVQRLEDPQLTWVVTHRLAFGNMRAAEEWRGASVCVNEKPWCCAHKDCVHWPILDDVSLDALTQIMETPHDQWVTGSAGHETTLERLEPIRKYYEQHFDEPVLIHCTAGRERSVLATTYLLVSVHGMTWEGAHQFLLSLNSGIFDRRQWLSWKSRELLE